MMAKMFYTLDETKAALGRNEEEIKQLTREGRLREFRDGPRLMFKADQVEALKNELGSGSSGSGDQISLGPTDSGAPIGLVDSRSGGSMGGSGLGISLADSESQLSGSGMQMQMKDDTALAADLGLSGSIGGMPSPGQGRSGSMAGGTAGGSMAGGSMSGMSNTGTGRGGINVFGEDSVEHADPLAQTAISQHSDQVNLDSVGSGSGLLDLTRESDDTSLGAELLDEVAPGTAKTPRRAPSGDTGTSAGVAGLASPARGVTAPPIYIEAADPAASGLGAAALGAAIFCFVGFLALFSGVTNARPGLMDQIAGRPAETRQIWILFGIGAVLAVIFGVIGLVMGKRR
ncbi:MAG TPA: hypothetical protein VF669_15830 [Tepidisphaeraceae bacterium]|jgi:hypothetical protein